MAASSCDWPRAPRRTSRLGRPLALLTILLMVSVGRRRRAGAAAERPARIAKARRRQNRFGDRSVPQNRRHAAADIRADRRRTPSCTASNRALAAGKTGRPSRSASPSRVTSIASRRSGSRRSLSIRARRRRRRAAATSSSRATRLAWRALAESSSGILVPPLSNATQAVRSRKPPRDNDIAGAGARCPGKRADRAAESHRPPATRSTAKWQSPSKRQIRPPSTTPT